MIRKVTHINMYMVREIRKMDTKKKEGGVTSSWAHVRREPTQIYGRRFAYRFYTHKERYTCVCSRDVREVTIIPR